MTPDPHGSRAERASTRGGNPLRDALLLVVGVTLGLAGLLIVQRLTPEEQDPDVEHYLEVRRFVLENFVDEPNGEQLARDALGGMLDGLDRYSEYYFEEDYDRVSMETSGTYIGIGVVLKPPSTEGRILFPMSDSPAERAGLRVGDRIVAVDGASVEGLSGEELSEALQGEAESDVRITVVGLDGAEREHVVRRMPVLHPTVRHAQLLDEARRVGYLAVLQFSRRTPQEFDRAFEWLLEQDMQGLVLDLRGNAGGVLVSAVEVAQRFVAAGPIVSTRGRFDDAAIEADPTAAIWAGFPLVVLVDENSASASEVLAGALQDHRAAVLVGAPTHGKGMVQTIRRYPEQRAIARVTSSRYFTPANRNLERDPESDRDYGIVPDLELRLPRGERLGAQAAIHGRFGAPIERLAELRAWERSQGIELVDPPPDDAQVRAALDLFRGRRPGLAAAAPR